MATGDFRFCPQCATALHLITQAEDGGDGPAERASALAEADEQHEAETVLAKVFATCQKQGYEAAFQVMESLGIPVAPPPK